MKALEEETKSDTSSTLKSLLFSFFKVRPLIFLFENLSPLIVNGIDLSDLILISLSFKIRTFIFGSLCADIGLDWKKQQDKIAQQVGSVLGACLFVALLIVAIIMLSYVFVVIAQKNEFDIYVNLSLFYKYKQ